MKTKKILWTTILTFGMLLAQISFSNAFEDDDILPFKKHSHYNIYFQQRDSSSVINGAEILGFTEIMGQSFLVIRSQGGLKTAGQEGYVRFDAITAIVPEFSFTINRPRLK